MAAVPFAAAQNFDIDQYLGVRINAAKDSLRSNGFQDVGHTTTQDGTWALMWDGETCLALHGGDGVIDDIDTFRDRDCDTRRRRR